MRWAKVIIFCLSSNCLSIHSLLNDNSSKAICPQLGKNIARVGGFKNS